MYHVGHTNMKVMREGELVRLSPGADLPEARTFKRLRQMLMNGEVTCDYEDGETRPEQMDFVRRGSFLTIEAMSAKLRDEDIELPTAADFNTKEIAQAHDYVFANKGVPPAWLVDQLESDDASAGEDPESKGRGAVAAFVAAVGGKGKDKK